MGGLEPKTDFLIFPWAPWLYRFRQWFQIGGSCSKGNSSNLGYHAWLYGWFPLKWSTPKYLRTQISWIGRKDSKRHLHGYSACILHETFVLSLSHFPFFLSLQHRTVAQSNELMLNKTLRWKNVGPISPIAFHKFTFFRVWSGWRGWCPSLPKLDTEQKLKF